MQSRSRVLGLAVAIPLLGILVAVSVAGKMALTSEEKGAATHAVASKLVRPKLRLLLPKRATAKKHPSKVAASVSEKTAMLAVVLRADMKEEHRALLDAVLQTIPSTCRTNLQSLSVIYSGTKYRGLGGKTTILLDGNHPDAELVALLIHECGHVTHGNMQGDPKSGDSGFRDGTDVFAADSPAAEFFALSWSTEVTRKKGSKESDFISGYAQSDAFEDFAETFAAYILQRPMMRERAKDNAVIANKLAWMERYLPIDEYAVGASTYSWEGAIPWDITKLSYSLSTTIAAR